MASEYSIPGRSHGRFENKTVMQQFINYSHFLTKFWKKKKKKLLNLLENMTNLHLLPYFFPLLDKLATHVVESDITHEVLKWTNITGCSGTAVMGGPAVMQGA